MVRNTLHIREHSRVLLFKSLDLWCVYLLSPCSLVGLLFRTVVSGVLDLKSLVLECGFAGASKAFEIHAELLSYCKVMKKLEAECLQAHDIIITLKTAAPGYKQLVTHRRREDNYLEGCNSALSELLLWADKVCTTPQKKMFAASDTVRPIHRLHGRTVAAGVVDTRQRVLGRFKFSQCEFMV